MSVPWPCAHEFLAVVSNPRIFRDPTPIDAALDAVGRLLDSLGGWFIWPKETATCTPSNGSPDPRSCKGRSCTTPGLRRFRLYHGVRCALVRGPRLLAIPRLRRWRIRSRWIDGGDWVSAVDRRRFDHVGNRCLGKRLELSHGCPYQILSLARLPISATPGQQVAGCFRRRAANLTTGAR